MPEVAVMKPGWRMFGTFFRARRAAVVGVLALSAVESLPALMSGLVLAQALDRGFLVGRQLVGLGWLGVLAALLIVRAGVTRALLPRLGALVEPLRDALVSAVVTQTLRRAAAGTVPPDGASVARLTGQVETVRSLVSALLRSIRQLSVSLVMALIGLAALAPPVVLIAGLPITIALAACASVLRPLSIAQRQMLIAEERIAREAGGALTGLRDLVACGARPWAGARMDALIAQWEVAVRRVAWISAANKLIVLAGRKLPVLDTLAAAPVLLTDYGLTAGALVGAVGCLLTSVDPAMRSMAQTLGSWGVELGAVLHRLGEEPGDGGATSGVPSRPARAGLTAVASSAHVGRCAANPPRDLPADHSLSMERVTFAYGPGAAPVIRDLSLDVPHSSLPAIVGPSGIGKSTIADLLAGLAVPDGGHVRLGSVDLGELDGHFLREHIALIPQEAYVFTGTPRENLIYLRPEATERDLLRPPQQ
ncbi:ATP-binding cassette domain-containing protein [Streptomyces sp. NPDC001165]|uniref:ATP-binding cassette domain-containing protein n=1 Tax=Streptomyces sp. NPDC001165 TaxID=3364546 RepID=UPI0036822F2F